MFWENIDENNCEDGWNYSGLHPDNFRVSSASKKNKCYGDENSMRFNKMRPHSLSFGEKRPSPKSSSKENVDPRSSNFGSSMKSAKRTILGSLQESPSIDFQQVFKNSRVCNERAKMASLSTPNKMFQDMDNASRDSGYENSTTKTDGKSMLFHDEQTIDLSEIIMKEYTKTNSIVPELSRLDDDNDFETLHDLEREFDLIDNIEECSKYEIISTDSPDIISRGGRTSRNVKKITSKNLTFGAPIAETEVSTSFNRIPTATRALNFDNDNDFEFASPVMVKSLSVKKSLHFNDETPTRKRSPKRLNFKERTDSGLSNMSSFGDSPVACSSNFLNFPSTCSVESGFLSEMEDGFPLEMNDADNTLTNSPRLGELISGEIKGLLSSKDIEMSPKTSDPMTSRTRPGLRRSISLNPCTDSPVDRIRLTLFNSSLDSPTGILSESNRLRANKRAERSENLEVSADSEEAISKRRKSSKGEENNLPVRAIRPVLQRAYSENQASVMSALARSHMEPDLIGDFSKPFGLPLTPGKHEDLKAITAETLADLMQGKYDDKIESYEVIDCRYPYEYQGGHIKGASNLYLREQILENLMESSKLESYSATTTDGDAKRKILVFHCEFSVERGPKLTRFLRSTDRARNTAVYPNLNYPEVYLLHDGYKNFYNKYPELCDPDSYTPMLAPEHENNLKLFRSQSHMSSISMRTAVTSFGLKKSHSTGDARRDMSLQRQKSRSRLIM